MPPHAPEDDVIQDLIRSAEDFSIPSIRSKALLELDGRGIPTPDNRGCRSRALLGPARRPPRIPREKAPAPLVRILPLGQSPPIQSGPKHIAIGTSRSTSSRISLMSGSARVSNISDCAASRYRATGRPSVSNEPPLSAAPSER